MKGLIYKDLYSAWKHCRSYVVLVLVFAAVSVVETQMTFYAVYPSVFCGTTAMTLLSWDERDKWLSYGAVLPVSRRELVSAKYLASLIIQGIVVGVSGLAQMIRLFANPAFRAGQLPAYEVESVLVLVTMMAVVSFLIPAIMMPWMFKLGTEKGRIAYMVSLGISAGILVAVLMRVDLVEQVNGGAWQWAALGGAMALFAASWLLSVRFFEKRDL